MDSDVLSDKVNSGHTRSDLGGLAGGWIQSREPIGRLIVDYGQRCEGVDGWGSVLIHADSRLCPDSDAQEDKTVREWEECRFADYRFAVVSAEFSVR